MGAKPDKRNWHDATVRVMARVSAGCKLSEFTGLDKRVAERLFDRGRIHGTRLSNGDYLLNK